MIDSGMLADLSGSVALVINFCSWGRAALTVLWYAGFETVAVAGVAFCCYPNLKEQRLWLLHGFARQKALFQPRACSSQGVFSP